MKGFLPCKPYKQTFFYWQKLMFVPGGKPFPPLFSVVRSSLLLTDNKAACDSPRATLGQSKYLFIRRKNGNQTLAGI